MAVLQASSEDRSFVGLSHLRPEVSGLRRVEKVRKFIMFMKSVKSVKSVKFMK